jgi:hypothetical protein
MKKTNSSYTDKFDLIDILDPESDVKKRPTTRESRSLRAEPAAFFGEKEFPGLTSRPGRSRIALETKGFS